MVYRYTVLQFGQSCFNEEATYAFSEARLNRRDPKIVIMDDRGEVVWYCTNTVSK